MSHRTSPRPTVIRGAASSAATLFPETLRASWSIRLDRSRPAGERHAILADGEPVAYADRATAAFLALAANQFGPLLDTADVLEGELHRERARRVLRAVP